MAISPAVIAEPDRLGLRRTSFKEKVTMGIAPNRLARSAACIWFKSRAPDQFRPIFTAARGSYQSSGAT